MHEPGEENKSDADPLDTSNDVKSQEDDLRPSPATKPTVKGLTREIGVKNHQISQLKDENSSLRNELEDVRASYQKEIDDLRAALHQGNAKSESLGVKLMKTRIRNDEIREQLDAELETNRRMQSTIENLKRDRDGRIQMRFREKEERSESGEMSDGEVDDSPASKRSKSDENHRLLNSRISIPNMGYLLKEEDKRK